MSSITNVLDEPARADKLPDIPGAVQGLTPRQREVLALIGQGLSTAEIARRLYRTVKTIESHRLMLGKRLGARNRVELARIAIQAGLTDLSADSVPAESDSDGPAHDATCRALSILESGAATAHGQGFLQAMVSQLVTALGASAAYIVRIGADGTARSVVGASERGAAEPIKYPVAQAEDAGLGVGEVRVIEGAPAVMFADAHPDVRTGVVSSLAASLHDSRGQRQGTLAVLLKTAPDQAVCTQEIIRLLAGRVSAELERKEAEDRFNHLQSLVSSATDRIGLWERDLRDDRQTWSTETYRILGLEPHSIVPTRERFFSMVHPDDRARVMEASNNAARACTASVIEYQIIRVDGGVRRIQACYQAAPDVTGRPGWVFGMMKDITPE